MSAASLVRNTYPVLSEERAEVLYISKKVIVLLSSQPYRRQRACVKHMCLVFGLKCLQCL